MCTVHLWNPHSSVTWTERNVLCFPRLPNKIGLNFEGWAKPNVFMATVYTSLSGHLPTLLEGGGSTAGPLEVTRLTFESFPKEWLVLGSKGQNCWRSSRSEVWRWSRHIVSYKVSCVHRWNLETNDLELLWVDIFRLKKRLSTVFLCSEPSHLNLAGCPDSQFVLLITNVLERFQSASLILELPWGPADSNPSLKS